ncbi:hypothetical protein POV27_03515 [Aureisphaera galaxeae]|uniref:hypothetical protein n=1 Tax=Aureisphaera galaxeae TaxID=1538023 RepID=UPI002350D3E3|nr:hypothetical protein [Aureisphaera galaxeae]MDC8003102.1 hypothetical protein [Aureisphaera galaxeae]
MTPNGKKIKNYFSKNALTKKITDQEFDTLIKKAMNPLHDRALEKTLLHEKDCVSKTRIIYGLKVYDYAGAEINYKVGKDGYIRYIPIVATILNFTQHEIIIYQCVFDPITENALNECTWTYFYKEVVSLETKEISKTKEWLSPTQKIFYKVPLIKLFIKGVPKQYNVSKKFIITTRGSSQFEMPLSDYEAIDGIEGKFNVTDAENTIRAIRSSLRSKKWK